MLVKKLKRLFSKRSEKKMAVRPSTGDDIAAIIRISAQDSDFMNDEIDGICAAAISGAYNVLTVDGAVVGFFFIGIASQGQVRIFTIVIDENYQRKGYGTFVIRSILKTIRKTDADLTLTVVVPEISLAAIEFFKSCGFLAIELWPDFYEHFQSDAVLMSRGVPQAVKL